MHHITPVDIKYFETSVKQKISHTYLHQFLGEPAIDKEKLSILISIANRANLSPEHKETYIVTTMLVQLALDIHDHVPNKESAMEYSAVPIERQLTVLAGDYYSGLYYFLLSEINDFTMIQTLATAIKEINEYKMKLYYQEIKSAEMCFAAIKKIESLLLSHVLSHLELDPLEYPVEEWLFIHKLIQEQNKLRTDGTSSLFHLWSIFTTDANIQNFLDNMIETQLKKLQNTVTLQTLQRSPSTIKKRLYNMHVPDMEEG